MSGCTSEIRFNQCRLPQAKSTHAHSVRAPQQKCPFGNHQTSGKSSHGSRRSRYCERPQRVGLRQPQCTMSGQLRCPSGQLLQALSRRPMQAASQSLRTAPTSAVARPACALTAGFAVAGTSAGEEASGALCFGRFFFGAPSMGAHLRVQVPLRAGHSEQSEATAQGSPMVITGHVRPTRESRHRRASQCRSHNARLRTPDR